MEILTQSNFPSNGRKSTRRRERPCDICRKRKTRCITKPRENKCVHCQLRGSTCTFKLDPPKRPHANESQDHAKVTPPVEHSNDLVQEPASPAPSSGIVLPNNGSDELLGSQSSSGPSSDRVSEVNSLGLAPTRFAELYGLGSDMEPILMRHRPYDPTTHEFNLETHAIRRVQEGKVGYPLTFHMVSDERALGHESRHSQAIAIEACVRPHGPHLVDLFWRHIQPCYPLLHRDFFMQNYNKSFRRISPALLGAVYLSALKWWPYNPELSVRDPPDSTLLRRLVKSAIETSYHQPRLWSVQAILLLLQCQPEDALNPDHTYAWGLTCQALAIGQCLGLHLDASQWGIPTWEKNVRRRLSWALYMQDRWTALAYGRPVHIHHDDWSVQELTFVDFVDCESSGSDEERRTLGATGNLQFMHMVRLTLILSSILSSFYTARTSSEQDTVLLYQKALPILNQLQTWYSEIPASLQMNITYQRKLCFHGYLHFSYYGVMMTLLRRLIRSTALPPRCPDDQILAEIRQLALQTSQGAINFVVNLRPDQLESFWYFTSPYLYALLGSFTTLLLVTSLSSQERNFWQETLNSYLWNLRTVSKSSEPMRYAVNRLEGAILRGLEHALAVNLNDSGDDEVSPLMVHGPTEAFEYTDFGHWDLAAGVNGSFDFLTAFDLDAQYLGEL